MSYEYTVHYMMFIGVIYIKCARNFFFEKKKTYSWVKTYIETLKIHIIEDWVDEKF